MQRSLVALASLLLGCGETPPEDSGALPAVERVDVLPLLALSEVGPELDPLASHRPAEVACSPLSGWYIENEHLETNTAECNYLFVEEAAATEAFEGEILRGQLSHFDLTAPEPTQAHFAVLLEGEVIGEHFVEIPGSASIIELAIPLPRSVDKGVRVGIHLHNHGQNTWNLSKLYVERPLD